MKPRFYLSCVLFMSSISLVPMSLAAPAESTLKASTSINQNEMSDSEVFKQQERLTQEKAAFWGLTVQEWHTFEALTEKGGRRYWSPNLDPLTTLGVEAKTQAEREHYARLLAKKEFERTEKELEFQRVYNKEFKKMYPDILPVELDDNPNFVAPLNQEGERMTLFLDVDDVVRGIGLLDKALKANKEMDIYLLGTSGEDERIQMWAKTYALPVNLVKSGFITLNHDQGQWQQIGKGVLPILLQEQNGGKFRQIELGD